METIMEYITLYAPIVIAILSEVGVIVAMISKVQSFFKKTDDAVKSLKENDEYKQLKDQLKIVARENAELKNTLNNVIQTMTKVKVPDDKIENN